MIDTISNMAIGWLFVLLASIVIGILGVMVTSEQMQQFGSKVFGMTVWWGIVIVPAWLLSLLSDNRFKRLTVHSPREGGLPREARPDRGAGVLVRQSRHPPFLTLTNNTNSTTT